MKLGIARPRPTTTEILLMHDHMPSFPSGHAASAFTCATFLAFAWRHWWAAGAILVYAGMIALSRVYVGVHYPTDVLVGSALGVGIGYLLFRIAEKRAEVGAEQFFGFFMPPSSKNGSIKDNEYEFDIREKEDYWLLNIIRITYRNNIAGRIETKIKCNSVEEAKTIAENLISCTAKTEVCTPYIIEE